jgi:uncharacterized phage protein (predicted DNA packaging)
MVTVATTKNFLRIDADMTEDDALIQSLILAARQYIVKQTGKAYTDTDSDNLWDVCICLLVSHWYENRQLNPAKPGLLSEYPHSVSALINHIALCSDYPVVAS